MQTPLATDTFATKHTKCKCGGAFIWMWGILLLSLLTVRSEATRVRVASYNLQNYLVMDRMVEGDYQLDYPKPEVEKAALREVVLSAQPDVLAIQEIGGELFLQEFQADLAAYGLEYPYVALGAGEDSVRYLAVLSKIPFAQVERHQDLKFKYFGRRMGIKRGLLEVVFGEGDAVWTLYVVHLKSRWTNDQRDPRSQMWRVKEAESIRDWLLQRYEDDVHAAPLLLVGDLNDTKGSSTLRRFLRISDRSLLRMLPAVDSRGEYWTYHYRKEDRYERVDYLLASTPMWQRQVQGSATIVDVLPASRIGSDHRLLYADFIIQNLPEPLAPRHETETSN